MHIYIFLRFRKHFVSQHYIKSNFTSETKLTNGHVICGYLSDMFEYDRGYSDILGKSSTRCELTTLDRELKSYLSYGSNFQWIYCVKKLLSSRVKYGNRYFLYWFVGISFHIKT